MVKPPDAPSQSAQAPAQPPANQAEIDRLKRENELLRKRLDMQEGKTNEKEVPGWRIRLYPYTPSGDLRFKDWVEQFYYLNGPFDFRLGHPDWTIATVGIRYSYMFEAVFRPNKPGVWVFGFELNCNDDTISKCAFIARVDDRVATELRGEISKRRHTMRVEVGELKEYAINLIFTGSQSTYFNIRHPKFSILTTVRGPDDNDFRNFRRDELFVRVPKNVTITPRLWDPSKSQ